MVRACRPRAAVALGPRRVHAPRRSRHDRAGDNAQSRLGDVHAADLSSPRPGPWRPGGTAGAAPRPRLRRTRREGRAGRAHGDERGAAPTADRGRPDIAATALGLGDEPAVDDDRTFADLREPARSARADTVVTLRSGGGASGPRRSTSTRCARRWTATRAWSSSPFPAAPVHCASSAAHARRRRPEAGDADRHRTRLGLRRHRRRFQRRLGRHHLRRHQRLRFS